MVKKISKKLGEILGNENFFVKKNMAAIIVVFLVGALGAYLILNPGINQETVTKVTDFMKTRVPPEVEVTLSGFEEVDGLVQYTFQLSDGQEEQIITVYSNKDGSTLYPDAFDLEELSQGQQPAAQQPAAAEFDAPDKEIPATSLFIMAFCPYGTQAEEAMLPVARLFGEDAYINIRYILTDSQNGITSLHGQPEVDEAARQLCVREEFGKESYWNYLEKFNSDCVDLSSQSAYEATLENAETCSKSVVNQLDLDFNKFESCVKDDSLMLLKTEAMVTKAIGVGSSPTLLINDEKYNGARTPEGYKKAVCSGFINTPELCSQALSTQGTQAAGNC
jgi:hypothetical protein